MKTVNVQLAVPEGMAPYLEDTDRDHSFERNAMMLYPFIQNQTISHGRAAEILGVHKFDLIDFYASLGMPYLHQSVSELEEELADIRSHEGAAQ